MIRKLTHCCESSCRASISTDSFRDFFSLWGMRVRMRHWLLLVILIIQQRRNIWLLTTALISLSSALVIHFLPLDPLQSITLTLDPLLEHHLDLLQFSYSLLFRFPLSRLIHFLSLWGSYDHFIVLGSGGGT